MVVRLRRGPSAASRGAVEAAFCRSCRALPEGDSARLITQVREDLGRSLRRREPDAEALRSALKPAARLVAELAPSVAHWRPAEYGDFMYEVFAACVARTRLENSFALSSDVEGWHTAMAPMRSEVEAEKTPRRKTCLPDVR